MKKADVVRQDRSGFSVSTFRDLDALLLYAKPISSAEFALEAPRAGTARTDVARGSPKLILGLGSLASQLVG